MKKAFIWEWKKQVDFVKDIDALPANIKKHIEKKESDIAYEQSLFVWTLLKDYYKKTYKKDMEVKFGSHGKPYLVNSEFEFCISHSNRFVVLVISDAKIGVDIEEINTELDMEEVLVRIMENDIPYYVEGNIDSAFLAWVVFESAVKYYGATVFSKTIAESIKTENVFYTIISDSDDNQYYFAIYSEDKEKVEIYLQGEPYNL
jgi:phosphopantetheinyl transferase